MNDAKSSPNPQQSNTALIRCLGSRIPADLTDNLLVVKSVFIIERLLIEMIQERFPRPDKMPTRLQTQEIIDFARATRACDGVDWVFVAIEQLEKIQHYIAHQTSTMGLKGRIGSFVAYVRRNAGEEAHVMGDAPENALRSAILTVMVAICAHKQGMSIYSLKGEVPDRMVGDNTEMD